MSSRAQRRLDFVQAKFCPRSERHEQQATGSLKISFLLALLGELAPNWTEGLANSDGCRPSQPRDSSISAISLYPATIRIDKFLNACRCVTGAARAMNGKRNGSELRATRKNDLGC
jgi:hypothetical protein